MRSSFFSTSSSGENSVNSNRILCSLLRPNHVCSKELKAHVFLSDQSISWMHSLNQMASWIISSAYVQHFSALIPMDWFQRKIHGFRFRLSLKQWPVSAGHPPANMAGAPRWSARLLVEAGRRLPRQHERNRVEVTNGCSNGNNKNHQLGYHQLKKCHRTYQQRLVKNRVSPGPAMPCLSLSKDPPW